MRKMGRPLVSTVKGRLETAILDACSPDACSPDACSQQEAAEHLNTIASIRSGLAQARKGLWRSAREVFDDLDREALAKNRLE